MNYVNEAHNIIDNITEEYYQQLLVDTPELPPLKEWKEIFSTEFAAKVFVNTWISSPNNNLTKN